MDMGRLTLREQDLIWSRKTKPPDVLLCLGYPVTNKRQIPHSWWLDHRQEYDIIEDKMSNSVDRLLATLFYIELVGVPFLQGTSFLCRAQIRCRLPPSQPGLRDLVEQLRNVEAFFEYHQQRTHCINKQLYDEVVRNGEAFSRSISFSVSSLEESIDVKVNGITRKQESISNCPYSIETLIRDQGLHCVFGHRDHKITYKGPSRQAH
jgi:hypothetical protein